MSDILHEPMTVGAFLMLSCGIITGWLIGNLLGLLIYSNLPKILSAFHDFGEQLYARIYKLGAGLFPRRFQEREIQTIATHSKFLEHIEMLLRRFYGKNLEGGSSLRAQICKDTENIVRSDNLIPLEELVRSFRNVCQAFAQIIRNELKNDELVQLKFCYIPNYLLMRLNPLWEQIVEQALLHCPLVSDRIKNFANQQGPQRSYNSKPSGNKRGKHCIIHNSLLQERSACDKTILIPAGGVFNVQRRPL